MEGARAEEGRLGLLAGRGAVRRARRRGEWQLVVVVVAAAAMAAMAGAAMAVVMAVVTAERQRRPRGGRGDRRRLGATTPSPGSRVEFTPSPGSPNPSFSTSNLCLLMKEKMLLPKPTHSEMSLLPGGPPDLSLRPSLPQNQKLKLCQKSVSLSVLRS